MTDPDPTKTLTLALTPITAGATPPNLQTDAFATVIAAAQQGGDATQAYFDGMNQTADYWGWVADNVGQGENVWADGVDPAGNPIQMSSNGNLAVRMGSFYREPPTGDGHVAAQAGDPPPVVGIATIQTHNTTTGPRGGSELWARSGRAAGRDQDQFAAVQGPPQAGVFQPEDVLQQERLRHQGPQPGRGSRHRPRGGVRGRPGGCQRRNRGHRWRPGRAGGGVPRR